MRVLFSSTWGYGHVFPMVPLARAFLAGGHDVLWATNEPACVLVAAAGIDVVPAGLRADGVAAVRRRLADHTRELRPQDHAAFAFPHMFGEWATPAMVSDLLRVARDWGPDLMIHEHAEMAAPLVATLLSVPSVTHSYGGAIPRDIVAAASDRLATVWADYGHPIPPYAGSFTSAYVDICPPLLQRQSLEHIPSRHLMRPALYSGERGGTTLDDLFRESKPLVYVTFGTVRNDAHVIRQVVAGVSSLNARILATVGPDGEPNALDAQPDHVRVERWVPNSDVIPRCALVISHCGAGTCLHALSHGVPQLCLPQTADQFRNAESVVAAGAGLMLHPDEANRAAIAEAATRLLDENSFRIAAARVADEIQTMPMPARVVRALEISGPAASGILGQSDEHSPQGERP